MNGWVYALGDTSSDPQAELDQKSIIVCRQCREMAPRCDVCGVPVGRNHIRLPDGRCTCTRCHQTAVYDPAHAQMLFERVTRAVVDQLGLGLNVGTGLTLVDDLHMQRLTMDASLTSHDIEDKVVGLFIRKGRKRTIYILSGLPQILLIQTMAHEWAHAWQGENCPLLQNTVVREGFAEWVAYKILQTMRATKKMALMERRNGLYGEGLRQMLELEQSGGVSGVIAFCRRAE
ncbi:MAG: protein DA1 [Chloroflexi bacterium]|nr:protein DA1 [Chloroflexota bacterium]